jgi:hypothetical protein
VSLVLLRSVLFGNRAITAGGGVRAESGGSAFILNATIAFNHSAGGEGGGGVSIGADASQIRIVHATIVANVDTAGNFTAGGGGIGKDDGASRLELFNSVVAGNIVAGGFVDLSNGDIDQGGNNFVGGDPRLGPLKANGGPTFSVAPLADSPLLDAGDTTQISDTTVDQRGLPRVVDGDRDGTSVIDIGAVEFARRGSG